MEQTQRRERHYPRHQGEVLRMKTRPLFLTVAAIGAIALGVAALTAVWAGDGPARDASTGNASDMPATASPAVPPPIIDPGIGNGKPPADPGVAPRDPAPPYSPNLPASDRDLAPRATPQSPATPPSSGGGTPGVVRVLAPIEAVDMAVLESYPPRYRLLVKAGLPSGCAKPDGYDIARAGSEVRVAIYNTLPDGNPICTTIYGIYDLSIDLGSDFVSGQEYRVNVNGEVIVFKAQ
jgi:hypothetical protein